MSRFFIISLPLQILLILAFLVFGWQADQAMDKSGLGNVETWRRFNSLAGIAFYGAALLWLATITLALFGRVFSTFKAQVAVGLPPLALVIGWCLSWVV